MHRTSTPDLSLRDSDDGTTHIEGRAVPYNTPVQLGGIRETFAPGSVNPADLIGAPILWQHNRAEIIGRIDSAEDRDDGAHFTGSLIPTARGIDAVVALRAGAVSGLSIGFDPVSEDWAGDHVTRTAVRVREVSVATLPAYDDAAVLAVRREREDVDSTTQPPAAERSEPDIIDSDTQHLAERVDRIEARMLDTAPPSAAPPLSVRETFTQLVTSYGDSRVIQRADMVAAGNTGLTDTARTTTQIVDYFDATRYFVSQVASLPFPTSGITHTLPKKTQRSLVGQSAEKTEAPSRAITTGTDTFTGEWYKGYLDIGYELIRTSTPGAVAVAVDDMLEEAAVESELTFVVAVEAASTLGTDLDFTDYASLIASLRANITALRAAAGKAPPKFALTSASWDLLLGLTDGDGRRVLATAGPVNADGQASLLAETVNLSGILLFESPHSTADVAFNDNSLMRSELPPVTLQADNVPNMGRDVGVIGNIITIPRIAAGVLRCEAV